MLGCFSQEGLCSLKFLDKKDLEAELSELEIFFKQELVQMKNDLSKQLRLELEEYFEKKRKKFSVPLHLLGTPFQLQVWGKLLDIPYGSAISYKEQAATLDNPRAVRAAANANGKNRVAVLVPCHRVVGLDGSMVGYNGGLARKRFLLDLEKNNSKEL